MSLLPLAAAAAALAQVPVPPPTFTVGVEAVYVDVFVTEGGGPVSGLTEADFELKDDGVRQGAELVAVESLPLTTFLVLDTSGSVSGEKLVQLQAAGRALLRGMRPGDEVALLTFGQEIAVRVPATGDRPRVERALNGILPGGTTALFDALYVGALLSSARGRSLLVLFTDGEDNVSWLDADQLRRVLEESNVLVQVVGVLPPPEQVLRLDSRHEMPDSEPPHVRTLRHLAAVTGGRFWTASAPDRLASAFLAILEAMKTRYVLRFEPSRGRREGRHSLDVRLTRHKGKVLCRRAYFVGPTGP